jgi:flagellar biosynthesis/type III secretory pathway protein FliH
VSTNRQPFLTRTPSPAVVALVERLAVSEEPRRAWNLGQAPAPIATPTPAEQPVVAAYHPDPEARLWEAFANAEKEGLRVGQEKVESVIERYLDGIRRLEEVAAQGTAPMAAEVVELAMTVAREIIGRELTANRDLLVDRLAAAFESMRGEGPLTVRLGKADASYVKKRRPDLAEAGIVVVEDETLGVGGAIVESSRRVLDASIEARLEAVRDAIRGVLGTDEATK